MNSARDLETIPIHGHALFDDYRRMLIALGSNNADWMIHSAHLALKSLGVYPYSPAVAITYDQQTLEFADNLREIDYYEPHTIAIITDAAIKRKRLDSGETVAAVGFPSAVYSEILNLAVIVDDTEENSESFGATYARARTFSVVTHELTHSSLGHLNRITKHKINNNGEYEIVTESGLSHAESKYTLKPGDNEGDNYLPVWIEEAFAVHSSNEARCLIIPESIPEKDIVYNSNIFGVKDVVLPKRYSLFSEEFPEKPGPCPGALAGHGLELLDKTSVGLIRSIREITARRSCATTSIHNRIKNSVGVELYGLMFSRQPYSIWGDIYSRLSELS